jgi:hypothetical protein
VVFDDDFINKVLNQNKRKRYATYDFILHNPNPDVPISHQILNRICKSRLRSNFQTFIFITGGGKVPTGTGQGKSYFALKWVEIMMAEDGLKLSDYLDDILVFTPLEYAEKMKALIEDPRLKDIHYMIIDEATEVLDANEWHNFLNRAIRAVNVKSRAVKNLVVFLLSPNPMDLEKPTRRMLTFYCEISRGLNGPARAKVYRPTLIRRGLDDFYLDKTELVGKIFTEKRSYVIFPKFTISMPSKEVREKYDLLQRERKGAMVMRDLNELITNLRAKYGDALKRVNDLVDYFISKPAIQPLFLKWRKSKGEMKVKLNDDFIKSFQLSKDEQNHFLAMFMMKVKAMNKPIDDIVNNRISSDVVDSDMNNENKDYSDKNNSDVNNEDKNYSDKNNDEGGV